MHMAPGRFKARGNSFRHASRATSLKEGGYADAAVMCASRCGTVWAPFPTTTTIRGRDVRLTDGRPQAAAATTT